MVKWLNQVFRGNEARPNAPQNLSKQETTGADDVAESLRLKELADVHMRNGENDAAEALYRQAIALDAGFANAYCNLGFVLRETGRLAEAMQNLSQAVALRPDLVDAHYFLGVIARDTGDRESAIGHLQNALHVARDFEPAYVDLAHILIAADRKANLHTLLVDGVQAIPESAELNFLLGRFLYLDERFDEAIPFFQCALAIAPAHEEAWVGQVTCAKYQFLPKATIRFCQIVLTINPAREDAAACLREAQQARKAFDDAALVITASSTHGAKKVRLVCATKVKQDRFFKDTALGKSLHRYARILNNFELQLFPENSEGLPLLYNRAIEYARNDPAYLVFIHDDVFLTDLFWTDRIAEALQTFDVFGIAGNTRRVPAQPSWYFTNDSFVPDESRYLSGTIGSGKGFPDSVVSRFGDARQECKLLDGVFLAAHSSTLLKAELYFDTRFRFHFYDIDFCRQAELKNLRMGTWPLSLVHVSNGNFGSTSWWESWLQYREKYSE